MSSTGTPNFQVSASPATLTLTAGQSGTVTASVTPVNAASLTTPMFVTLSCSGLPDQSSCTFTPENVEIQPGVTAAITSTMVVVTQMASTASAAHARGNPVAWALLLPGVFGLGGLAWGSRRRGPRGQVFVRGVVRRWLNRLVAHLHHRSRGHPEFLRQFNVFIERLASLIAQAIELCRAFKIP